MRNTLPLEQGAQLFRLLNGHRPHQHRLAAPVTVQYLRQHGVELSGLGLVDHIGVIHSDHGLVGRDYHHV